MPAKIVELTVELLVQAVSCPGVWLCPGGEVSLSVFALGCSHRTARLPPAFPLLYRDAFYFRKTFRNACSLASLPCALAEETIYCELVQWTGESDGRVLAQYLGSLSDVLFPPDTCSSDGVDLLMRTTTAFPGILAPKVEVSTKVRVDEVWEGHNRAPDAATPSPARSPSPSRSRADPRRQVPVCHSKPYHDSRCHRSIKSRDRSSQANRLREDSRPGCSCSNSVEREVDRPPRPRSPIPCPPPSPLRRDRSGGTERMVVTQQDPQLSNDGIEERNGEKTPTGGKQRWPNAETTVMTVGRPRVSRLLESESTRRRTRSPRRRGSCGRARDASGSGPCVCDICRRYHQLFHTDRDR